MYCAKATQPTKKPMVTCRRVVFLYALLAALGPAIPKAAPPPEIVPGSSETGPVESGHRSEAIRRYEALLANPSPALAGRQDELMFRLGVLYLEEVQAAGPGRGSYGSRESYDRALSLFQRVLGKRESIFREDTLYYRAIALEDIGRSEEAATSFRTLLREFPSSSHAAEVWFRLANEAVQKHRLRDALAAYEEVLRRGDQRYRDQASYMFAWTAFSLGQSGRSRPTLVDLLQRLETGGQRDTSLYAEAIELLAKVIRSEGNTAVLSGPWIGARPAFAQAVLRRTADLFRETSAYRQAALSYEQLAREYPDLADGDAVEKLAIDCYLKAGDPGRAEDARMRLIQRHLSGSRLKSEALTEIGPILKDSAVYIHQQARETKRTDLYHQAIDAYQMFAESVPDGPSRWEIVFFQAEALKEAGDLGSAAERYRLISESKDPAHGEEAGFRRIVLLEELKNHGLASVSQVLPAYEDYFRAYPAGAHELELRERYAGYLFDEKRYADSLREGSQVVARAADPAERRKMRLLLARASFATGDYFQCANWATQLLSDRDLAADSRNEVEDIHATAIYKGAESLKDKPLDSAAQYELLVRLYPRHKFAPAALYNAASGLRDSGEKARALGLFRRLVETYPAADVTHDATAAATAIYKELGDPTGAADLLERAAGAPGAPPSTDLLFEAGLAARAANSPERTIALFKKFLDARRENDLRSSTARIAIAKAHWQLGHAAEAGRVARETIATAPLAETPGENSQKVQLILAEARFLLGDTALRRFSEIRLSEPVAKSLKLKQSAMEEAVQNFTEAATYGFADVSLASYYKIGYAQSDFADAVMQAPRPRNLSPTERVQYEALLREQVSPYRQAAEKSFRLTLEQGKAAGVENEWTARARVALDGFGGETPPILPGT